VAISLEAEWIGIFRPTTPEHAGSGHGQSRGRDAGSVRRQADSNLARSTKEGQGCATALGRFENVAKSAAGSWHGHEASLEAARCQIAMGNLDPARDRLNKLTQVSTHATPAKTALDELNAVAARRQAGTVGGGAHATKAPAKAAPAPAAAPKATASPARDNSAAGF
jgi:hypothetical protein